MSQYVDGYLIPIKKKNVKAYMKMANLGCKLWMEHGALDYYECIGDDLKVNWGQTFPKLCKLKKDETVVLAFVVFKSKKHRASVNAKVHSDTRMKMDGIKMPFDVKRFSMGGFKALVYSK
ncbi:MAG: DUF1428 domain-containing protein [Deltaproteobacteria bacterium]|nr:DUF1428 domain-containing protein [Deltaproteobacteria bacterium]